MVVRIGGISQTHLSAGTNVSDGSQVFQPQAFVISLWQKESIFRVATVTEPPSQKVYDSKGLLTA